jgi:hypothetical protein
VAGDVMASQSLMCLPECFAQYQSEHVRLTTWVVALPMLVEAVTSVTLAWKPPAQDLELGCWGGLLMVIVILGFHGRFAGAKALRTCHGV